MVSLYCLSYWNFSLTPRLFVGVFLVLLRRGWMVQFNSLNWRNVPFLDTGNLSLLRTDSGRVCEMMISIWYDMNITVRCKKKSFLSTSLITNSSLQFWRNLRALGDAQSSASIFLHLTIEIFLSWIIIFLILYLLRFIPLTFLLIFFPPLLTFPRSSTLFQSFPMISTIFLSAFAWLPLDLSDRMLLLCLSLDPFLYMLNFFLSHSTFPSFLETFNCSSHS